MARKAGYLENGNHTFSKMQSFETFSFRVIPVSYIMFITQLLLCNFDYTIIVQLVKINNYHAPLYTYIEDFHS